MKKSLIFAGMLVVGFANAQETNGKVGVNTETPSATLNVKSKTGTTSATKNFELENADGAKMVTVLDNGYVGIGVENPETNLQINYSDTSPIKIKNTKYSWDEGALKAQILFSDKNDNVFGYLGELSSGKYMGIVGTNYSSGIASLKRADLSPDNTTILAQSQIVLNASDNNNRIRFWQGNQGNAGTVLNGEGTSTTVDYLGKWHFGWGESLVDYRGDAMLNIRGRGNTNTTKTLQLSSLNATRLMTVLDNGNMGLGTEFPIHRLQIETNQLFPVGIKNNQYAYTEGELNSSIAFKDKNDNVYGYVGDVSAHSRFSLLGRNVQTSIGANKYDDGGVITGSSMILMNPESDKDRIIIETVTEGNIITRTYVDKNGNWRIGVSTDATEKLEVGGSIRSTALSGTGNRVVYADANGVLKVGNAYATNTTNSLWTRDEATNTIKLAVNSDGTDRTNAVTIDNAGAVYASSLKGYNGATIFPDYVFQKYYTGNSSIKADYTFKSLSQVEDFVKANGHLPGYKSAEAIKAQGYVDLMETQLTNVEKIEELYLHTIELKKENEELKARLEKLEKLLK